MTGGCPVPSEVPALPQPTTKPPYRVSRCLRSTRRPAQDTTPLERVALSELYGCRSRNGAPHRRCRRQSRCRMDVSRPTQHRTGPTGARVPIRQIRPLMIGGADPAAPVCGEKDGTAAQSRSEQAATSPRIPTRQQSFGFARRTTAGHLLFSSCRARAPVSFQRNA